MTLPTCPIDSHDWVEDDGFTPMADEDHYCCVCGAYRMEVQ